MNCEAICARVRWTWTAIRRHPWANVIGLFAILGLAIRWAVQHSPDKQLSTSTRWVIFVTLSAAILGLFRDAIVRWIWFPDLDVTYDHNPPFIDAPPLINPKTGEQTGKSYYFRMIVANRGSARADKVEVLALDVRSSDGFTHRYSMDLKWAHSGVIVLDGLSPGIEKYVDIGCIMMPIDEVCHTTPPPRDMSQTWNLAFVLRVEVEGTHRLHYLSPGTHELNVIVVAANHLPLRYKVTIKYDGRWSDKMQEMKDCHVTIGVTRTRHQWWQYY